MNTKPKKTITRRNRNNNKGGKSARYLEILRLTTCRIPRTFGLQTSFALYEFIKHRFHMQYVLASAINGYAFYELNITGLFRPDPLVAGSVQGFLAAAARYSINRAMRFKPTVTFVNLSATLPTSVCVILRDTQPSLDITSYAAAQAAESGGMSSGPKLLGTVSGMNRAVITMPWIELGDITGNFLTYYTEQGYEGTDVLNANQALWIAGVGRSLSAANPLVNGFNMFFDNLIEAIWHSLKNIIL